MITLEQLVKAVPTVQKLRAAQFVPYLNAAMAEFEINTPLRQAAFLAQVFHESANLSAVEENLNYKAETLMRVWPKRFPTLEKAQQYAHNPEKLANSVYASRMGNRDEGSGDGFKHRGAGLIQLTGRENHIACALALDVDPDNIPDYLKTEEGACRSAAWFWQRANANKYADKGDFDGVSDVVNIGRKTDKVGDSVGWEHRNALYKAFTAVLGAK